MSETLSIGEVAGRAGVSASTIRYYESVGVLPEPEREGGRRRYGPDAVDRLKAICVAQQAGFSLKEIGELFNGTAEGDHSEQLRDLAQRKLPEVEELIDRAEAMKRWLQAASGCKCPTLDVCALFELPNSA